MFASRAIWSVTEIMKSSAKNIYFSKFHTISSPQELILVKKISSIRNKPYWQARINVCTSIPLKKAKVTYLYMYIHKLMFLQTDK